MVHSHLGAETLIKAPRCTPPFAEGESVRYDAQKPVPRRGLIFAPESAGTHTSLRDAVRNQ
jgi:hypothetical protein